MTVGEQVRKYRKLKKWTLSELGERTGLSVSYLSEIESKAYGSIKAVRKIADALGVDIDYLFKEE